MPEPIDYIQTAAGFVPGEVYDTGRKISRPNAQVTALAIFDGAMTGVETTYQTMFPILTADMTAWAKKPGRRSKHRKFFQENPGWSLHSYRMPMEFLRPWIEQRWPDLTWVSTNWIGAGTKLHLDEGVFGDDLVLARLSADQVVPVIKGIAHFPWDPNSTHVEGSSRMVYGYWTQP